MLQNQQLGFQPQPLPGENMQYFNAPDVNPQYVATGQMNYASDTSQAQIPFQQNIPEGAHQYANVTNIQQQESHPTSYQTGRSLTQTDTSYSHYQRNQSSVESDVQNQSQQYGAAAQTLQHVPQPAQPVDYSQSYQMPMNHPAETVTQYQQYVPNMDSNQLVNQQMQPTDTNFAQYQQSSQPNEQNSQNQPESHQTYQSQPNVQQQPSMDMNEQSYNQLPFQQIPANVQPQVDSSAFQHPVQQSDASGNNYVGSYSMPDKSMHSFPENTSKDDIFYSPQQSQMPPQFHGSLSHAQTQGFNNFQQMNPQEFYESYQQQINSFFSQNNAMNEFPLLQQMYAFFQQQPPGNSSPNFPFSLHPNHQQQLLQQFKNLNQPPSQSLYNLHQNLFMQNQQPSPMVHQMDSNQTTKPPVNIPFHNLRFENLEFPSQQMPFPLLQPRDSQSSQPFDPKQFTPDQLNMMFSALQNQNQPPFSNASSNSMSYPESQQQGFPKQQLDAQQMNYQLPSEWWNKFQSFFNVPFAQNQMPSAPPAQQFPSIPPQYLELFQKIMLTQNMPFSNPPASMPNKVELESQHFQYPELQEMFMQWLKQMSLMGMLGNAPPNVDLSKQQEFLAQLYRHPDMAPRFNQDLMWKMRAQTSLDASRSMPPYVPPTSEVQKSNNLPMQSMPSMTYSYTQPQQPQLQQPQDCGKSEVPQQYQQQYVQMQTQYQQPQAVGETVQGTQHRVQEPDIAQQPPTSSHSISEIQSIANNQTLIQDNSQNAHQQQYYQTAAPPVEMFSQQYSEPVVPNQNYMQNVVESEGPTQVAQDQANASYRQTDQHMCLDSGNVGQGFVNQVCVTYCFFIDIWTESSNVYCGDC